MPRVIDLAIYALAVARLTGLATHDEITRPVREAIVARFDEHRRAHRLIAYLVGGADDQANGCPWCASIWIAFAIAPIAYANPASPAVAIPTLALALSQVAGMISRFGRE